MYILKVLVEHSSYQLDRTFDYLSNDYVETGCRVSIPFGRQKSLVMSQNAIKQIKPNTN